MENIFDKKLIHRALKKVDSISEPRLAEGLHQPVHTFYGGAHLFMSDTPAKMGRIALKGLNKYAASRGDLEKIFTQPGFPISIAATAETPSLFNKIYDRLLVKLSTEPVEDYRIDFEDGYGIRRDGEEDHEAARAAAETCKGMMNNSLPRIFGIRIKPLNSVFLPRALRTLEIFLTKLHYLSGGILPANFIVTVPKTQDAIEVELLNKALHLIEERLGITKNSIRTDLMIESPSAVIFDRKLNVARIIDEAGDRCMSINLGIYDYTSMLDISSQSQSYTHPSVEFLRQILKIIVAQKNVNLIDGATHIMPVEIYKAGGQPALSAEQEEENRISIHNAWRLSFNNNMHSLHNGIYQGWDLHPYQLIPRYCSLYYYFLSGLESTAVRMKNFLTSANNQTLTSHFFDDAASASGLYNYFVKAVSCGALTDSDLAPLGRTRKDFLTKSFREMIH